METLMSKYRHDLPQLGNRLYLTDGGIETTLIYLEGLDLPHFAAFDLLKDARTAAILRQYYVPYAKIARQNGVGLVLESATWRASRDWGEKLGYGSEGIAAANQRAIALLKGLRDEFETTESPMPISGCIGPRGDGYDPGRIMSEQQAEDYHAEQAQVFAATDADLITAITMTSINEAVGLVRAARNAGMPVVISFTLETDGLLPTGDPLGKAIETVDARTGGAPAYYMVNCAHPTHFQDKIDATSAWSRRLRGLRANASCRSHAELDAATDLDDGNPVELGAQYKHLRRRLSSLTVLGGCCGTDHRHVAEIAAACRVA
jgi:homocysteine S-methyltransferase